MTREFGVRRCWPGRKADSSCLAALARRNDKEKQIPPGSLRSRVGMTRELGGRRCWPGRKAGSSWLAALARRNDKEKQVPPGSLRSRVGMTRELGGAEVLARQNSRFLLARCARASE